MISIRLAAVLGVVFLSAGLLVGGTIVAILDKGGPPVESAAPRHESAVDYCTDIVAEWAGESFSDHRPGGAYVGPEDLGEANDLGDGIGSAIARAARGVEADMTGAEAGTASFSLDDVRADCRR